MKKKAVIFLAFIFILGACKKEKPITPIEIFDPNALAAFPGAEGFGRNTTGGRGGDVVYVTNLNAEGSGSLNEALGYNGSVEMQKPRYILFKVSGIIDRGSMWHHQTHIEYGDFTLAGHTSKGGIILGGLMVDDRKELDHFNNMIIRHIRSRPKGISNGLDDAIRLNKAQNVIIDHCSFEWASDEVMQIANNKNMSIQNTLFAETIGEHYDRGGILVKYSSFEKPNTGISFHHNTISRIGGRLPQVSPVFSNDGRGMEIEISNNLIWDAGSTKGRIAASYVTNFVTEEQEYSNWWCHLNFINNYLYALECPNQEEYWTNVGSIDLSHAKSNVYTSGNKINVYSNPNKVKINDENCLILTERNDFPMITYHSSENLFDYMVENVGAFPRDAMDRRLISSITKREIDPTPCNEKGADDGHIFDWKVMPIPELDSDDDGMPDWWEIYNGLNPLEKDHNGTELSERYTGAGEYENIEIYLNRLSDNLVKGESLTEGDEKIYENIIQSAQITNANDLAPGKNMQLKILLNHSGLKKLEISLALINAPFSWPAPACVDITSLNTSNQEVNYSVLIPSERTSGKYQIMVHAQLENGTDDYNLIDFDM